ncbi:MAG TPA: hypothetical protein PLT86_11930 [Candidatus Latescibacteria bacterium]|nr:hypothetical protein [Candidatus Latescibacterota bacterium]HPC44827.1 hypothetical protein [Candidatus Latescibacterota bacterium]HQK22227.1 hypothetical protein [Candidatus Latescibacterota bacterium]
MAPVPEEETYEWWLKQPTWELHDAITLTDRKYGWIPTPRKPGDTAKIMAYRAFPTDYRRFVLAKLEAGEVPIHHTDGDEIHVVPIQFLFWRLTWTEFAGPLAKPLRDCVAENLLNLMETGQLLPPPAAKKLIRHTKRRRPRLDLVNKYAGPQAQLLGAALACLAAFRDECCDPDGRVNVTHLLNQMNSKAQLFWDTGDKPDDGWDVPQHHDTVEKLLREWLRKTGG